MLNQYLKTLKNHYSDNIIQKKKKKKKKKKKSDMVLSALTIFDLSFDFE